MADSAAILDKARAHFDNMRGQTIEIPEWGMVGEDAATFDPPTLRVRQVIQHRAGKSESRQFATTVILCLKDADGKPVFKDDAPTLAALEAEVDPQIVSRIFNRILTVSSDTALGN